MAGNPLGAAAPTSPKGDTSRPFYRVPASTRTRRLQGVCLAGDLLLSVYSSRQAGELQSVSLTLCDGFIERTGRITAEQAHAFAQALHAAAQTSSGLRLGHCAIGSESENSSQGD